MFRILINLEEHFFSVEDVLATFSLNDPIYPTIPRSRLFDEDGHTQRICVAPTIEQCFTAIGTDAFDWEAIGYGVSKEITCRWIYPIILLEFSDDENYYYPTTQEVPDVLETCEAWLLEPTIPISAELLWIAQDSLSWDPERPYICTDAQLYTTPLPEEEHPWLNGKGSFMSGRTIY